MDSTTREHAESLLLEAARAYGIRYGKDEVHQALIDPEHGPAFAQWATSHLGSDNLLTAEEMALYAELDKSGEVDRLAALHDLAEVQAVTEDEIRTAVEELKRSTDAITKQTETLQQQQDAFTRLVKKTKENESKRRDFELTRQRKSESEHKHIAAEVEGLSQSLDFHIASLEQQDPGSGNSLHEVVDGFLRTDDKLLSSLQKLSRELDQQDPDEAQTVEKLREICMRLIKNTVETLRTKLDRLFLEALAEAERRGEAAPATKDEVDALQEEVESLYSEILPVAQMSVEQQHLEPALKYISSQSGQNLGRSASAINYINDCLDYLLDRNKRLETKVQALKSWQVASSSVVATAKRELDVETELPPRPSKPAVPASPVRPRPRANTANIAARRRSSGIHDEPPMESLLNSLSLPLDEDIDGREKARFLAEAVVERAAKWEDVARSGQDSFENLASSHMEDLRAALQLLKDSLLAESSFSQVQLSDPEIEGSISFLSNEVDQIQDRLDRAKARIGTIKKSDKKEDIVRRWGS